MLRPASRYCVTCLCWRVCHNLLGWYAAGSGREANHRLKRARNAADGEGSRSEGSEHTIFAPLSIGVRGHIAAPSRTDGAREDATNARMPNRIGGGAKTTTPVQSFLDAEPPRGARGGSAIQVSGALYWTVFQFLLVTDSSQTTLVWKPRATTPLIRIMAQSPQDARPLIGAAVPPHQHAVHGQDADSIRSEGRITDGDNLSVIYGRVAIDRSNGSVSSEIRPVDNISTPGMSKHRIVEIRMCPGPASQNF